MDNGADSRWLSNSVSADNRGIGVAPCIHASTVTSSYNINIYQGAAAEKRKEMDYEEEPEKKKPKPLSEPEPEDAVDSEPALTEYSLSKMEEYADRNRESLIGLLENEDGLQEKKEKLKSMKLKKCLNWRNIEKVRKINKDFRCFVSQSKFPWSEVESFLFEKVGKSAERGRVEVDETRGDDWDSSGYFSSMNTEDSRSSSTLTQPAPAPPLEEDLRKNHLPEEREDRELSQGLQTGPAPSASSTAEDPRDTAEEPSRDTAPGATQREITAEAMQVIRVKEEITDTQPGQLNENETQDDLLETNTAMQPTPTVLRKNHLPEEREDRELSQGLQTGPAPRARSSAEEMQVIRVKEEITDTQPGQLNAPVETQKENMETSSQSLVEDMELMKEDSQLSQGLQTGPAPSASSTAEDLRDTAEEPSRDTAEEPSRDTAEEPSRDTAEEPSRDTAEEHPRDTAEDPRETAPSAEQHRDSPAPKKTSTQPSNAAAETKKEQKLNTGVRGMKKEIPKGVIYISDSDSDSDSAAGVELSAQTQLKEESTEIPVGQLAPSAERMERINSRERTQDPSLQLNHEAGQQQPAEPSLQLNHEAGQQQPTEPSLQLNHEPGQQQPTGTLPYSSNRAAITVTGESNERNQQSEKGAKKQTRAKPRARKDKAAEEECWNKAFKKWLEHTAQSLAKKEGKTVDEVKKQIESDSEITFIDNWQHAEFTCLTARECIVFEHEGERIMVHIDKRDKCLTLKGKDIKEGFMFQLQYTMWILGDIKGTHVVLSDAEEILEYKFNEASLEEFHVNFPQIINKVFLPAIALYKQAQRERAFQ